MPIMLILVLVLKDRFQVLVHVLVLEGLVLVLVLVLASQFLLFQVIVFYLLSIQIMIIHCTIYSTIY